MGVSIHDSKSVNAQQKTQKQKFNLPRLLMGKGGMFLAILIYGAVVINPICYGISENKKKFTIDAGKRIVSSRSTITTRTYSSLACTSLCTSNKDCVTASYDNFTNQCKLDSDTTPTIEKWQNALLIRIDVYQKDCGDFKGPSGVYTINPDGESFGYYVYCDMETDGGRWTVFQNRYDGNLDFYKNWKEYEEGFGDVNREFWLGNDKLHKLTSISTYTLRVLMEDFDNETRYAQYKSFTIGDAASKYKISLSSYSGDAGDSLTYSNNMPFTTYDQNNKPTSGYDNCAVFFHGAWWYRRCHHSNLNGGYLAGDHISYGDGMNWLTWRGFKYSYKATRMMIRRQ